MIKTGDSNYSLFFICLLLAVFLAGGCATPIDTSSSHTKILNPDQEDNVGGSFLESTDIRTMAQQVCTELLSLPQINTATDKVRIATGPIKNSTRYTIDSNLLMSRLRLDLNKYSQDKIGFFAHSSSQALRSQMLKDRQKAQAQTAIEETARYIAGSDIIQKADKPVKIMLAPVANTNLFNMNADGFASQLRTKIKEYAGDKVLFASPGADAAVDYTLTGEFFAQSIKEEGIANTVKDLEWAQNNPEQWNQGNEGQTATTMTNINGVMINSGSGNAVVKPGPNAVYKAIDPQLWNSPNVTKSFNVMLVNNEKMAVIEKVIDLEKEITTGQENAQYILTGEISSLSKAFDGKRSDYVLVSFYLNDPESNETVWEYGYEVKRESSRSVLYR